MEGSFYAVLGVDADADDATVRAAYRAAVKEHHPDVSDDPDAGEQFKRLTAARDVLLDPDERARYDRLGHAAYVSRHGRNRERSGTSGGGEATSSSDGVTCGSHGPTGGSHGTSSGSDGPTHTVGSDGVTGTGEERSAEESGHRHRGAAGTRGHTTGSPSGDDRRSRSAERAAWFGTEATATAAEASGTDPTPGSRAHRRATGRRHHVGTGNDSGVRGSGTRRNVDGDWGTASEAYQRSAAASRAAAARSRTTSVGELLASVGPWLVVYAVFVASAVATAAFTLGQAGVGVSLASFLFWLFLFGLVVALSTLHVASRVARTEGG